MSRKDVLKLLEMLCAAYPNTKIVNPYMTAKVWEEALKDYDAREIRLAARHHISVNKFFPTPSELMSLLPEVRIKYSEELRKDDYEDDHEVNEFLVNYMRLSSSDNGADGDIKDYSIENDSDYQELVTPEENSLLRQAIKLLGIENDS